jgi:hypothetical protein
LNPTKSQEFVNQFAFQGDQVRLPLIAKILLETLIALLIVLQTQGLMFLQLKSS